MKTPGELVRAIREAKGLTRKELSALINVPERTITNYELDGSPPSLEYVQKLAHTFEVNTNYIILGDPYPMFYSKRDSVAGDMRYPETKDVPSEESPAIDLELMAEIIEMTVEVLEEHKRKLKPEKLSKVIIELYKISVVTESELTADKVNKLLKMA